MEKANASEPDQANALVKAGLVVLVAFAGAIAANIWSTIVERYTPAYIGDRVVHAGHHVKVAVVYPQAVSMSPRYEQFQAGFLSELRAHTKADFIDEMVPLEDADPQSWLKASSDSIKRRGDLDYVVAIGTQATRALYEAKVPQELIGSLISSSGALRGEVDETRVTLLRDVADPDMSFSTLRVAKLLASIVQHTPPDACGVVMLEWQGEESSRQVRRELGPKLASHPLDQPHFLSIMDPQQLEYTLDRIDLNQERGLVVLHDRRLLNERGHISRHAGIVLVTSCPDDVQAQDPASPTAALGYAYHDLGQECGQGLLSKMRADGMLSGADSTEFDFVPARILRVNLGKLRTQCQESGATPPSTEELLAGLALASGLDPAAVQIIGGAP